MELPRCEVCGEDISKGKEKVVPPAMAGPSRVTMLVHTNPIVSERGCCTNEEECPRQGCASKRVHFVARGVDAGHGNYPSTNPTADIWECGDCRRPFLLTKG